MTDHFNDCDAPIPPSQILNSENATGTDHREEITEPEINNQLGLDIFSEEDAQKKEDDSNEGHVVKEPNSFNESRGGGDALLEYLRLKRVPAATTDEDEENDAAHDGSTLGSKRKASSPLLSSTSFSFLNFIDQYAPKKKKIEEDLEFIILRDLVTPPTDGDENIQWAPQITRFVPQVPRTNSWIAMSREQWRAWKAHVLGLEDNFSTAELESMIFFKILHSAISNTVTVPWSLIGTSHVPKIEFDKKNGQSGVSAQYFNNTPVHYFVRGVTIKRNPLSKHQTNMITFHDIEAIKRAHLELEGHSKSSLRGECLTFEDTLYLSLFSFQEGSVPVYTCDKIGGDLTSESAKPSELVEKSFSMAILVPFRVTYTRDKCYLDMKLISLYKFGIN